MPVRAKVYPINSVAVIGNHLPRQCGIATFTTDLCNAIEAEIRGFSNVVTLAMDDVATGYSYPERVKFQLRTNVQTDYLRAADFINVHQFDVVILEHEFGIFGGSNGAHILHLLQSLRMPVLTTLHTVLAEPSDGQRAVINSLAKYSDKIIVMSEKARTLLAEAHGVPDSKIVLIPHGIPDVAFVDTSFHKDQFGVEGRKVILTFGLLSLDKGIEYMIEAMPKIVKRHPDAIYLVLGATHPHVKKATGDAYRHQLLQKVNKLDLQDHVLFHNQFVSLEVLIEYISAADIYATPYLSPAQVVSGTLAYALGAGKAVVSTRYWYAEEMLAENRGRLVPFRDSDALAREIDDLLGNDFERNALRKRAYQHCRSMVWKNVARTHLRLAGEALEFHMSHPWPLHGEALKPTVLEELPETNLSHLQALTDTTGILQHATFTTPNREHGYCIDDNARALIVAGMCATLHKDESAIPLIHTYLGFLFHGFDRESCRFHNLMSYDRKWLDEVGSEDSHARAVWGLGVGVKYAPNDSIRDLATRLLVESVHVVEGFTSPRAWAFTLIGLHAYLEVYGGDTSVRRLREVLARKLYNLFVENGEEEWPWCEDIVTYDNAKLPHALILSGQWIPDAEMHKVGIRVLDWLLTQQIAPEGHLSIIGNSNWYARRGRRSYFDQQPIELMALVEACAEAYRSTSDKKWFRDARRCLAWFLGQNDLNEPLYDFKTGGCRDGLQPHGSNANEGAESTIAWLISLLTMYELVGRKILREA